MSPMSVIIIWAASDSCKITKHGNTAATDLDCCISSSSRDTGKTRQPVAVVMRKDGRLCEVNVSRVVIDDSDEVFDMYAWMFNENDITEQLGVMRKEDE